jgi:hypothetical protein
MHTDILKVQVLPGEVVVEGKELVVGQFVADIAIGVLHPMALELRSHPRGPHDDE